MLRDLGCIVWRNVDVNNCKRHTNQCIRSMASLLLVLVLILCVTVPILAQVSELPEDSVKIEGEDFYLQKGGEVEKVTRGGAETFRFWDNRGHELQWKVKVPKTGDYWLVVRYACDGTPKRELWINGRVVGGEGKELSFNSTGGWDRWKLGTVSSDAEHPMILSLKSGTNIVRMVNSGGGLNVDYFAFVPVSSNEVIGTLISLAATGTGPIIKFDFPPVPEPSVGELRKLLTKDYAIAHELVRRRVLNSVLELGNEFPVRARADGTWSTTRFGWESGFWVGMLWRMYSQTGDVNLLHAAEYWNGMLFGKESDDTHDLGFLFNLSSVLGYKLTGRSVYRDSALVAAQTLKDRFNPVSQLIVAFGKNSQEQDTIIDTMMNLQLLLWAYRETGDQEYLSIAHAHTLKTAKWLVTEEGSTFQSVHYDKDTGCFIKNHTHQGYSEYSTWSRGQAWGVYGFAAVYEATADPDILVVARRMADWAIAHAPEDHVPYYDYDNPLIPYTWRDSSAAAIMCVGFLKLSEVEIDAERACQYATEARIILDNLIDKYLAPTSLDDRYPVGGLKYGTYTAPKMVDEELIFGDYYLLEALDLMMQRDSVIKVDKTILVDPCSGNYRLTQDGNNGYELFAKSLHEKGYNFIHLDLHGTLTPGLLEHVDVVILNNRKERLYPHEIEALHAFIDNGGGLLLIGNEGGNFPELERLADTYGFHFNSDDTGYVWAQPVGGKDSLGKALANIKRFYFVKGNTFDITDSDVRVIAQDKGWYYTKKIVAVARQATRGRVVAIGDPTIWANEYWDTEGNADFAYAIIDYLAGN